MVARCRSIDVLAALAEENAELELVVEPLAIARPQHVGAGADDAEAVALVIDRLLVPDLGDLDLRRVEPLAAAEDGHDRPRIADMLLEHQEIPHLPRLRHRREQPRLVERDPPLRLLHQAPGMVERRRAAIDQRQHVAEIAGAVAGGEVDRLALARQQRADMALALGLEGDELHASLPAGAPALRSW
jgi:hypothetical protein